MLVMDFNAKLVQKKQNDKVNKHNKIINLKINCISWFHMPQLFLTLFLILPTLDL